ncbi:MAG: DUF1428 family protein [Alphaproteobacteria bacterium]|nr:DUF1428 family protein [Alphaproteobacteria bacterium]
MYVDGFLLPLPTKNVKAYTKLAKLACKVWMDHGALGYHECLLDDGVAKMGKSLQELAQPKKGETVVFAWIVFKNRKHRDSVNAKVMKDKRFDGMADKPLPFDCSRIGYAGFKEIVSSD